MSDAEYTIYCNGFWGEEFTDTLSTRRMNANFFADIFGHTSLRNFRFVTDIQEANVLFESVFMPSVAYKKNDWIYKIHFSGESSERTQLYFPNKTDYGEYDVVMCAHGFDRANVVDVPFFVYYCYNGLRLSHLTPSQREPIYAIPEKFCCYVVSNGNIQIRDRMFDALTRYKHVDSGGKHRNNMGGELLFRYTSEDMIRFISEYKFMICFENTVEGTYVTEKIVNALLGRVIPIYYGTSYCTTVFNKDAFLVLEDETEESLQKLVDQVIELDNDDEKYLEMLNRPVFADGFDYQHVYGATSIAEKMESLLGNHPQNESGDGSGSVTETIPQVVDSLCVSSERIYICLIAYRARPPQDFRRGELYTMIGNWTQYFASHGKNLKIVIVEQDNDRPFNKGVLWNAAFLEAERYYGVFETRTYIHNNSDNLINLDTPFPHDLNEPLSGFTDIRRVPHLDEHIGSNMLGGCCSFDAESFDRTGGFPNNLWGWGGDDWAIMRRIRERGVPYRKGSVFNTDWILENRDHVRDKTMNDHNIQLALHEPIEKSGLHNCEYTITRAGEFYDEHGDVVHLCVDM